MGAKITQIFAREEENAETFATLSDVVHGHRLIHGLKDTLQIGDVVDKIIKNIAQVHNGLPEPGSVGGNGIL